ncbi:probable dual specificity protein phosphatase DDB_G0283417 [Zerene cesonia]|uniref:probable dual specificity protein phosphatase DDB_G0283417 n=1 Tax=Zerene cesonia TaxID=33412 RepID=UPI0018E53A5D|nr:probable dual specificity protein phosphatase DDB_G0283417 [Zerene cesonia]
MSFLSELQKQKKKLKETETIITKVDGKRYIEIGQKVKQLNEKVYGFVVDTKPDDIPVLIIDHLYIGSQDCAVNRILKTYNIKHVLSLGIQVTVEVDNKFINIMDLPESDIKLVLTDCLPFVKNAIDNSENVLIHCNAGVSRTSMVTIAYLMQYELMSYENAYNLVKSKRPAIQPNDGFRKQLLCLKPGDCI